MTTNDTTIARLLEQLIAEGPQAMRKVTTTLMNVAMSLEREQFLGAVMSMATNRSGSTPRPERCTSTSPRHRAAPNRFIPRAWNGAGARAVRSCWRRLKSTSKAFPRAR